MRLVEYPMRAAHDGLRSARGGNRVATLAILVHDTVTGLSWSKQRVESLVSHGVTQKRKGGGTRHIPGPLYNWLIHPDGEIVQITPLKAKANHAGRGVRERLLALEAGYDPRTKAKGPSVGELNANGHLLGVALNRTGDHPVPTAQKEALYYLIWEMRKRNGLILLCPDGHPWRILGHRDWSPGRKKDPSLFDLDEIRTPPDRDKDATDQFLADMIEYLRV